MLKEICDFLDDYLRIKDIPDDSLNGLQVENSGRVSIIGVAVDASLQTFLEAKRRGVNLLIVHHGLFWKELKPLKGNLYRRIKVLVEGDIALYAAHLPLDKHPEVGNNAVGIKSLGWVMEGEFGEYRGVKIGYKFSLPEPKSIGEVKKLIEKNFGRRVVAWEFGKGTIKKGAFVSGSALSLLPEVIEEKLDIFITGEPSHSWFWEAKEGKINVVFAGHYYTETLGIKALGNLLSQKFSLPLEIIELPTGY
ncbi:Nif3-like dinuclear metal center hexameric protein [Candidatus Calescamantes bacterium]|nr:Nif3-like dinuclear metal center hexameric protein [Candidatus Calescamantes bacterium]